jgi:hypothetical protein
MGEPLAKQTSSEWAGRWAYSFIGMQTLITCAVAGMAIRMAMNDDPSVTTPLLLVSTTGAVLSGALRHRAPRSGRRTSPHSSGQRVTGSDQRGGGA